MQERKTNTTMKAQEMINSNGKVDKMKIRKEFTRRVCWHIPMIPALKRLSRRITSSRTCAT
jgi:hypothetical protein